MTDDSAPVLKTLVAQSSLVSLVSLHSLLVHPVMVYPQSGQVYIELWALCIK